MQSGKFSSTYRLATASLALASGLTGLTGCGITASELSAPIKATGAALQGSVHGGQQPVTGSTIQLYAANTTGYGVGSYALLTTPVTTNSGGGFNITGTYTCPSATSQVYITATGGNPGLSGNNPNLAMMAALGACGNLSASSFISINELTTVASVYPLAQFMTSMSAVSSSASNAAGLASAFATVNNIANVGNGALPGPTLPSGAILPSSELNTLADILASCINSAGLTSNADTTSNCGKLFAYSTPTGGTAPTDTVGAMLNIVKNPTSNVNNLLALAAPSSPFQPTLASAKDFTLSIRYTKGLGIAPAAVAIDQTGNLWIPNANSNSVSVLSPQGAPVTGSPYTDSRLGNIYSIAIDQSGNAWVPSYSSGRLYSVTPTGTITMSSVSLGGGSNSIAIDGQGILWIPSSSSNSVVAVTTSGATTTGSTTYTGAGLNAPVAVAINPH